jgi:hypothetical protein
MCPFGQQQQPLEAVVADEGASSFPLGPLPHLACAKLWGRVFLAPHKARYNTRAFHRCMLFTATDERVALSRDPIGSHRTRVFVPSSITPKHLPDLHGVVSHIFLVKDDAIEPFDL